MVEISCPFLYTLHLNCCLDGLEQYSPEDEEVVVLKNKYLSPALYMIKKHKIP